MPRRAKPRPTREINALLAEQRAARATVASTATAMASNIQCQADADLLLGSLEDDPSFRATVALALANEGWKVSE